MFPVFFHLLIEERNIPHAKNWDGEAGVLQRQEMENILEEIGDFAIKIAIQKEKPPSPKVPSTS